jgi:hypothetical protein
MCGANRQRWTESAKLLLILWRRPRNLKSEIEKRQRPYTVAKRSLEQKMEQHKKDMKQYSVVLDAEKVYY